MKPDEESATRFDVQPTAESHFSWIRTRLSTERTLMSFARTAIALIGFGFTLYQFLDKLNATKSIVPAQYAGAPRLLSLLLIGIGLLLLVFATIDYKRLLDYLHGETFASIANIGPKRWHAGTLVAVLLLIVCGFFAFFAVFLRI